LDKSEHRKPPEKSEKDKRAIPHAAYMNLYNMSAEEREEHY